MNKIANIRPQTSIFSSFKRLTYEIWTALAEFLDNSTQSFYDNEDELLSRDGYKLIIEIKYEKDPIYGDYITIKDNAYGMNYENFERAIKLNKPPKNTLGRNEFGMGLKTAATWFGDWWSVESTQLGSNTKYYVEMDIESISSNETEEVNIREDDVNENEHFTLITIKKLNRKINSTSTEQKIYESLSSAYREDIRRGKIVIIYNNRTLEFKNVLPYTDENGKVWKKDISFDIEAADKKLNVYGFIGIRDKGSTAEAGYTLMRRGRVIIGGTNKNYRPKEIFESPNSFPYQRLYGELHMDNWPVTQAKDNFDWSSEDLEGLFIDKLREISKSYKEKSCTIRKNRISSTPSNAVLNYSVSTNKQVTEVSRVAQQTNNQIDKPINNHVQNQEIEQTQEIAPAERHEFNFSQNTNQVDVKSFEEKPRTTDNQEPQTTEYKEPRFLNFEYTNANYKFIIELNNGENKRTWVTWSEMSTEKNCWKITLYMQHPYLKEYENDKSSLEAIIKFSASLVLAEIDAYEGTTGIVKVDPNQLRVSMDKILRFALKGKIEYE